MTSHLALLHDTELMKSLVLKSSLLFFCFIADDALGNSDQQLFECVWGEIRQGLVAKADALSKQKFHSKAEAEEALRALTPAGFLQNNRLSADCVEIETPAEMQALAMRLAEYAKNNPVQAEQAVRMTMQALMPKIARIQAQTDQLFLASEHVDQELTRLFNQAKAQRKLVLLVFEANWSPRYYDELWSQPDFVQKYDQHLIAHKIDLTEWDAPQLSPIRSRYSIEFLPVYLLTDAEGQAVSEPFYELTAAHLDEVLSQVKN